MFKIYTADPETVPEDSVPLPPFLDISSSEDDIGNSG